VWTIRDGTTFECADCDHQTSLTSGTELEKTRKPLKMWFRAVVEISTRRTGISAKDLDGLDVAAQAKGGDGASQSRAARPFRAGRRDPRRRKGLTNNELVLVAAEVDGRVVSPTPTTTMRAR
jgi:hypothetical protein